MNSEYEGRSLWTPWARRILLILLNATNSGGIAEADAAGNTAPAATDTAISAAILRKRASLSSAYGVSCRASAGKIALRPGATMGRFAPVLHGSPVRLPDPPGAVRRFTRRCITPAGGMSFSESRSLRPFVESTAWLATGP